MLHTQRCPSSTRKPLALQQNNPNVEKPSKIEAPLSKEIESLKTVRDDMGKMCCELQSSVRNLQEHLTAAASKDSKCEELTQLFSSSFQRQEELGRTCESLKIENRNLVGHITTMEAASANREAEHKNVIQSLECKLSSANDETRQKDAQITFMTSELQTKNEELKAVRQALDEMKTFSQEQEIELDLLRKKNATLESECDEHKKNAAAMEERRIDKSTATNDDEGIAPRKQTRIEGKAAHRRVSLEEARQLRRGAQLEDKCLEELEELTSFIKTA